MQQETKVAPWSRRTMLLVGVLLAAAVAVFWTLSYRMVTKQIIETEIKSIEELAAHDERSIMTSVRNRWRDLETIGRSIHRRDHSSTEELMGELETATRMIECIRLTLVSENGMTVNSMGEAAEDRQMLELCQESNTRFVRRIINENGGAQEMQAGIMLSEPVEVDGTRYQWLAARLAIDAFESELKIDSYDGRGYSSVIAQDGSYIVDMQGMGESENFFDILNSGTLPEGYSVERIQQLLDDLQEFSLEYTQADGDVRVIVFNPMPEIDWFFVTAVSREVFEEQSLALINIFVVLLAVMLLVVAVSVVMIFRRRIRILELEQKHREELSQALALAEQASRAKTTFLNNMSHDIRTPMNAIIGFTALASTHIDNRDRVRDYLGKITQSSNHLLSLINDVLDMSRIESGKMNMEEKPENLGEILHSLRNIIQADIHAKQLELFIDTVDVSDEDILCDKLRLNQVLLNILSNAIKFTPPGGTISLRTQEKAVSPSGYGTFEFRIKDTGIGMSPEFVKTIFEPFTQERSPASGGVQGTGLGMSITKNIVDMMGGDIQVTSEEGVGTEFVVTLDLKLQGGHREIQRIECLEGLRSLVVDDDMNACQSVAQMLRQIGMRPEWTMYGKEAVARTEEAMKLGDAFHVYIIDWLMPDMNGVETTRRIRKVVGDDAPIIILSAYDWSDIEDEARAAGVTDFISKPLFPSDLREVLMRACGEPKPETQEPSVPDESFTGKRLLLVEDNEFNQEIAVEILEDSGFVVEIANNGQEAVDTVRDRPAGWYDAILMDVQMPVMDGYAATRAIRKLEDPEKAGVPIIAMTANAFDEDRQAAYDAGMNAHVGKPIDVPALMEVLRHFA